MKTGTEGRGRIYDKEERSTSEDEDGDQYGRGREGSGNKEGRVGRGMMTKEGRGRYECECGMRERYGAKRKGDKGGRSRRGE